MIRVVRVIEYTYTDVAQMETDMLGWTTTCPPRGWKVGMKMKSAHFIPEHTDDDGEVTR